jgi:hypothetical protein
MRGVGRAGVTSAGRGRWRATAAAAGRLGTRHARKGRVDVPPLRGSSADFPSPIALESAGSASRSASARSRFALVIARTRRATTTVTRGAVSARPRRATRMKLRFSGSKTLIYACGPGVGGPTSAKPSWLSLSLRRCCHDQPSLVGDPRSLDGRYHSLLLTRNALLAFGPRVRVLS